MDQQQQLRISDVVRETGVAKELIHHYLRQGLLPPTPARARYSRRHVRLLRQIRTLRDDHNLSLDVIRKLFTLLGFDPARIESLTLSESLCRRITRFAADGALLSDETLTEEQLAAAAGVTAERVQDYLHARMVAPLDDDGDPRYSEYDAGVIALCEHGIELGLSFDSFRTIASYVRIAFDLEHAAFYGVTTAPPFDPDSVLTNVFVRREVAGGFVQSVLHAMTQRRIRALLEQTLPARPATLDDIVYRPSEAFVRRHGLDERVDALGATLRSEDEPAEQWLELGELLLHCGRYQDATFFLEECVERLGEDARSRALLGRALILSGSSERGLAALEDTDCPRAGALAAVALYRSARADAGAEGLLRTGACILERVDRLLTDSALPDVTALCGWLLASLPSVYGATERGLAVLRETVERLDTGGDGAATALPGLRDRHRINAAYLLLDRLAEGVRTENGEQERLVSLICRLDPVSRFAETVFLRRKPA